MTRTCLTSHTNLATTYEIADPRIYCRFLGFHGVPAARRRNLLVCILLTQIAVSSSREVLLHVFTLTGEGGSPQGVPSWEDKPSAQALGPRVDQDPPSRQERAAWEAAPERIAAAIRGAAHSFMFTRLIYTPRGRRQGLPWRWASPPRACSPDPPGRRGRRGRPSRWPWQAWQCGRPPG